MTARCYVSVHSVSHMSRLCQRRQKAETQSLPCSTRCPQVQSLGNMFSWSRESVFFENVVCGLVWTASPSGRVCIFPQSWLKRPVIRLNGNKQNTQPVGPVQPKVPRGGFCPLLLSAGELRKRLWGPGRFVCTDFTICMFSFFFFFCLHFHDFDALLCGLTMNSSDELSAFIENKGPVAEKTLLLEPRCVFF